MPHKFFSRPLLGFWGATLSLALPFVLCSSKAQAQAKPQAAAAFDADEILVKFSAAPSLSAANARASAVNARVGATTVKNYANIGWQKVKLPKGKTVAQAIAQYRALSGVVAVEPDYRVYGQRTPNDSSYKQLYGMTQIGAPKVWDTMTNSSSVIVAVVDTGVDANHPDLKTNMWRNPGETGGGKETNGIDDDRNGYVDDVHGINAIEGTSANKYVPGNPTDDNGHGTHCAGTIGAIGNNQIGVAGVNWTTRIMALKFLGASNGGTTSDALECYNYIIARKKAGQNIRVINNSWGGGGYSQAMVDAFTRAQSEGILSVVAAGNDFLNNDSFPTYPASYSVESQITVAASNSQDALDQEFSNYGARSVHIAAPGVNIFSTYPTAFSGGYATLSGTSMAAPHVAGAAAMMFSRFPNLTPLRVKTLMMGTATRNSSYRGKVASGGRLNFEAAFAAAGGNSSSNDDFVNATPISGDSGRVTGTNVGSTVENGETFTQGASVWWVWRPTRSGVATFSTIGSDFDTALSVYTGSIISQLQTVAFDDDSGGNSTSRLTFEAEAGQTYYILVDGYGGAKGNIVLNWNLPNNDNFANAYTLSNMSGQSGGSTRNASRQNGEPGDSTLKTVWWQWRPPISALATVNTKGSDFDTVVDVYRGSSLSSLTLVGSDNNGGGDLSSSLSWQAEINTNYYIRVRGYGTNTGQVVLNYTQANDNIARAFTMSGAMGETTVSSIGSTPEVDENNLSSQVPWWGKSLWWKWRPPHDGEATINTIGSSFDTQLSVFRANQGTSFTKLENLVTNDDAGEYLNSVVTLKVYADTTYYILVDGYAAATGVVVLGWDVPNVAPDVTIPNPSLQISAAPTQNRTFLVRYTDDNGGVDINEAWLQIGTLNATDDGAGSLLARVRRKEKLLELRNTEGTAWVSAPLPSDGSRITLRNAAGSVTLGLSDVVPSHRTLNVNWTASRTSNNGSLLHIRGMAVDSEGLTSQRYPLLTIGNWKVTSSTSTSSNPSAATQSTSPSGAAS